MIEKRKIIGFALVTAGIAGLLSAIIVTPEFATRYLSPDNNITTEGVRMLKLYRLLSFIIGWILLLIAVIPLKIPEIFVVCPEFAHKVFFILIFVYLVLFGYNTLTRTHDFSYPDAMNFVDVAKNISTGRGITQSVLGFNQPHFSAEDTIPTPLTAQPPLYPLLIALFSLSGLQWAESALLISIICYGLILLITYRLALGIYDVRTALLSTGFLLLYGPLYKVSKAALSEPLGILFLLTTFYAIIQINRPNTYHIWIPAMAGLTTGLAFITRYAFLHLFPICMLFIILESKRRLRDSSAYIAGFVVPVGLVFLRNLIVSSTILSSKNPSTVGFKNNALMVFEALTKDYSYMLKPNVQVFLIIIILLILTILLSIRRKLLITLKSVFIRRGGYLMTLWVFGYLTFLILIRTKAHFDYISWRLVMPAGVIICILLAALIVKAIDIKSRHLISLGIIIVFVLIVHEVQVTVRELVYSQKEVIAKSKRLSWIANNTTKRDLIIGNGTIDVAFYFGYPAVISFQYYPENDVLEYVKVVAICKNYYKQYKNIYLIVSLPSRDHLNYLTMFSTDMHDTIIENQKIILKYLYGPFISDILSGDLQRYPDVTFLERLSDNTYIYKITCQPNKKLNAAFEEST